MKVGIPKRIIVFAIVLVFLLVFSCTYSCSPFSFLENYEQRSPGKSAIAVLTKGYTDLSGYNLLIKRNKSLYNVTYSKLANEDDYDVIIFHEGNISTDDQAYIQKQTPLMPLVFEEVTFLDGSAVNPKCPPLKDHPSTTGYKNMCYFWAISFLEYLRDYDYVIRVDEDCVVQKLDIDAVLASYRKDEIYFSSPFFQGDDDAHFIVYMKELFHEYISENKIRPFIRSDKEIRCPYTNFMIVDIQYFRNNEEVQKIQAKIIESNCIWSNRWGDLPIWGYILSFFIDPKHYKEDKTISYYHGSHSTQLN